MTPISQGLPPVPITTYYKHFENGVGAAYTLDQIQEYGDARAAHARRVALNDAVAICTSYTADLRTHTPQRIGAAHCAGRIKEL